MPEEKKYLGLTKEELIENALIALIMSGISFAVTFAGYGVKTYVQSRIRMK